MPDDRLANTIVRTLSEYLVGKQNSGTFDPRLEDLRSQVEVKMSDVYATGTFARFVDKPDGNLEANMLRQQLIDAIAADREFAEEVELTINGVDPLGSANGAERSETGSECPP